MSKFNPAEMVGERGTYNDNHRWIDYDGYVTESLKEGEGAIVLADAMLMPDFKNRECLGKEFWLIGYACKAVEVNGDECLQVVLIGDDWTSYSTVSNGVATIITKWISAGVRPGFDHKIRVKYENVNLGRKSFYTLKWVKNYGTE